MSVTKTTGEHVGSTHTDTRGDYAMPLPPSGRYIVTVVTPDAWCDGHATRRGVIGRGLTARAVGALPLLVEYASPLLALGGIFVAWKGARDDNEEARGAEAAAEVGLRRERVVQVEPFPEVRDRNLVVYRKVSPCPERFPRRPGMAAKRPLA